MTERAAGAAAPQRARASLAVLFGVVGAYFAVWGRRSGMKSAVVAGVLIGGLYGLLGLGLTLSWGLLHLINIAYFGLAFLSANLGAQEVMGMAASGAKYGMPVKDRPSSSASVLRLAAMNSLMMIGVL